MDKHLQDFNIILRNLRISEKKTQKDIAKSIGITYQSYQAYELGLTLPTLENFMKLCNYFELTPNEILGID